MEKAEKTKKSKNFKIVKQLASLPIIVVVMLVAVVLYINSCRYESTDDAFVDGRIIRISPKVSGTIQKLNIEDNQFVKKGDLLLVIDDKDYQVKFNQAKAKHQILINKQGAAKADVVAKSEALVAAENDYNRYSNLYAVGAVSKQEYDSVKTKYEAAKAKLSVADEQVFSKDKNKVADAELMQLQSGMKQAALELSYTKIFAPCDGQITNRSAEKGAFIHAGAPLFSIVPAERWVTANFKETQLENMKIGQEVKIKIDAYPKKRFKGKIDSIQASTGAKTSLFPPENAVGSYVKIVQRVPVKIVFIDKEIKKYAVVPGMSVVPKVKVK